MRHEHVFAIVLPFVSIFACVGDGNNPGSDASDVTNDVPSNVEAGGDVVLPTGATISVTHAQTTWVAQGGQTSVAFTIARNGVAGALTVHATGLPAGMTAADATVPDGQTNGTLVLAASGSSTLGATASANIQLFDQTQLEDQKSVVVGVSGAPGTLDTTWGQSGAVSLSLTNRTIGYSIDIYPASAGVNAGKIVVAGVEQNSLTDVRLIIARLLPTGQLDTTFGDLVSDGGTARSGYVLFDPGVSDDTKITTYPVAVRVDSKGRIVMSNNRFIGNVAPFCDVELGRWTVDGDVDSTFTRFSGGINGFYCGTASDVRILANDDVAVLANWNENEGLEAIVQLFNGTDGSRQGSGYHVRLDTTGTNTSQQTTRISRFQVDKQGGYLLAGAKCNGGWNSPTTACVATIARLGSNGALDTAFGTSAGYTTFAFGSGTSQTFYGLTIDPTTNDAIMVGQDGAATLSTIARVTNGGLPASFGTGGSLTRDLLAGSSGQGLLTPLVDSASRIVAVGNANKTQNFIGNTRSSASGTADSTYGTAGINATTLGVTVEAAITEDDRIYVAGYSGTRLVVWRYWP